MQRRLEGWRVLLALAGVAACAPVSPAMASALFSRGYTVIPEPQRVEFHGANFEFANGWRLALRRGVQAKDEAAKRVQFKQAVADLDQALDLARQIREERNEALLNAVATWYKSWLPRVAEANGRKYLNEVDDVKDHLPARAVDMSYLVYRELILPFGKWYGQVEEVRNQYARTHGLPTRTQRLNWKNTGLQP